MDIEYEATFPNVNKNEVRQRLQSAGAVLIRPEFVRKSAILNLPEGHGIKGGWLRVRYDGEKNTMSLKVVDGTNTIAGQKEIEITVDNFESAVLLLENTGCEKKADQESTRELWKLDDVEVTIDEWPFLEPFVEVEGHSEETVKEVSEKIGFDYATAIFDSVDAQYHTKYGVTVDGINNRTPKILFEMDNPFVNRND